MIYPDMVKEHRESVLIKVAPRSYYVYMGIAEG